MEAGEQTKDLVMTVLFERLQGAAKPYERAVAKTIAQSSQWTTIIPTNEMDYDVKLKNPLQNKEITIEVKVHEGCNGEGIPYDTACIEILEYQYRHNDYVQSHWLTAPFDVMAHVDKTKGLIHLYSGEQIREWALAKKHTARYSKRVKTANILMPWIHKPAGYLLTLPLQGINK